MKVDHTDNLAGNGAETGTASALYASASRAKCARSSARAR